MKVRNKRFQLVFCENVKETNKSWGINLTDFTIIHLSDLHIVNGPNFKEQADFNADNLAKDYKEVASENKLSLSPDKTFILITGDITDTPTLDNYDGAIYFLKKLRENFNKQLNCMENVFPLDHIIYIPGNHDIEIPKKSLINNEKINVLHKKKYRNFKLFIDELTEYSFFARDFKLGKPFINATFNAPLNVQFFDINSTYNIHYREQPVYVTDKQLKGLFPDTQHHSKNAMAKYKPFQIAIMHHNIDTLKSDQPDAVTQERLREWLKDNDCQIFFCGHGHSDEDVVIDTVKKDKQLLLLQTGCSFLHKGETACSYQIVNIKRMEKKYLIINRKYHAAGDDPREWDWANSKKNPPAEGDLRSEDSLTVGRNFIGATNEKFWAVLAHCDNKKLLNIKSNDGVQIQPPGVEVGQLICNFFNYKSNNVFNVDDVSLKDLSNKKTLFMVDSSEFNKPTKNILANYSIYMTGGDVEFKRYPKDDKMKMEYQTIKTPKGELKSNKDGEAKVDDAYTDYLLIMRLPFFTPITEDTNAKPLVIDRTRVIWVIAGIHTKASYAGAKLFTEKNMREFIDSLIEHCGKIPEYFETVYELPSVSYMIDDFKVLKQEYFKELRLKSEIAISDDMPYSATSLFLSDKKNEILIDTVHFDPVAACNFNCKTCIEKEIKKKQVYLSLSKCVRILCDLRDCGCQHLKFYGGEPTLHPEFDSLLRLSSQLGFNILLVTNGSKLGEEQNFNAIVDGKNQIHVRLSLDANSSETHCKNHGLPPEDENHYKKIVASTEKLLNAQVTVSISFLLHKESIDELDEACKHWKEKGAAAFILRPVTDQNGRLPSLEYSEDEMNKIKIVIQKYMGFVFTPPWFELWLNDRNKEVEEKEYDECYSGYYRIAISPYTNKTGRSHSIADGEMAEVNNAWISLCTYNRYNGLYGSEYPSDLKSWCEINRERDVQKIKPHIDCKGIICCRHAYNKQIHDDLLSKKQDGTP